MIDPKLPKGHRSLYSPGFKYTPAAATDVARTFRRVRREFEAAEAAAKAALAEFTHVVNIRRDRDGKR